MSRLDSFIRRMQAQRACLDAAARLVEPLPGNVLEFGLGNGRTYSHLRERLSGREIFAFDRQVAAHPDSVPPTSHLFVGDVLDTLPTAIARLGSNTALANLDIGGSDDQATEDLVRRMVPLLLRLLKPDAVIVSGRPIEHPCFATLPLPHIVKPGRHFLYARTREALEPANDNRQESRRYVIAGKR